MKDGRMTKARAPGKLILSGEHAVVHGRPALVTAVNRYAQAAIQSNSDDTIRIVFPDMFAEDVLPVAALPGLKHRLLENYNRFLTGELGIRHVLGGPVELLQYAVIHLFDEIGQSPKGGLDLSLSTDLPIGCGMGSSAAVIAAVLGGIAGALQIHPDRDTLYRWTLDVEKLQHGHPSGVDPFITVHGGFIHFQQGEARPLRPLRHPMHLALTGAPESTTGECVAHVSQMHPATDPIWTEFEQVANEFETALHKDTPEDIRAAVRANHRLLTRIGVVPQRVQRFIEEIESTGGAAKTCGAGSIAGHAAGVVLVVADPDAATLCRRYGYDFFPVQADSKGLTTVESP